MAALLTLTTDFGTRDPYVAAMKGVLLAACPEARLVDLGHDLGAHDVLEGALFLAAALPRFPEGTVHLAVIDPGVGGARRPVAMRLGGHLLVCPDNGLAMLVLRRLPLEAAHVIDPARLDIDPGAISPTFHGRDLFAPAAAALACGRPLEQLGPPAGDLVALQVPQPVVDGGIVRGEVIHVDRFGNAATNIEPSSLAGTVAEVTVDGRAVGPLRRTYGDVEPGEPLALVGSAGYLEVAVREGSAAEHLVLSPGLPVEVRLA